MNKFFAFLFFLLSVFNEKALSQTYVSDTLFSNTTWSVSGSPYIVFNDVFVDTGITLTIDPGVTVRFGKNKTMVVNGLIRATGNTTNLISFEADTLDPTDFYWAGIYLSNSATPFDYQALTGCFFQYCSFSNAGIPNITLDASGNTAFTVFSQVSLGFDHCTIAESSCGLVGGAGSQISNSIFKECTSDALSGSLIKAGQNSGIFNNLIYKTAMAAGNGLVSANKNIRINNNLFIENEFVLYNAFNILDSCKFYSNSFIDNIGAYVRVSGGSVYENTFVRNEIDPETILLGTCDPDFYQNNVLRNESAFQVEIEIAAATGAGSSAIAENNYWGYTDSSSIAAVVKDEADVSGLCTVDFIPFNSSPEVSAPIIPPLNVMKKDLGNGSLLITWSHNTEADLAGYRVHHNGYTGYSFTDHFDAGEADSFILNSADITEEVAVTAYDHHIDGIDDQFEGYESWFTLAHLDSTVHIEEGSHPTPSLLVFPNPSGGTFYISIPFAKISSVSVYDMSGKKIREILSTDTKTFSLQLSDPGVYYLKAVSDGQLSRYEKIIVLP